MVRLASEYGHYGYRWITALLRTEGRRVNAKWVERIWRREGLKVPRRQPKRGRLWLTDGSCLRLRPYCPNHAWAYDFVEDRTHDGPELTARPLHIWLGQVGVKTLIIQPDSPWENGYNKSFNGKLHDELLDRKIFSSLHEAKVLIERWRRHYNTVRPHSALDYQPPAPEASLLRPAGPAYASLLHAQPGAPLHRPTLT